VTSATKSSNSNNWDWTQVRNLSTLSGDICHPCTSTCEKKSAINNGYNKKHREIIIRWKFERLHFFPYSVRPLVTRQGFHKISNFDYPTSSEVSRLSLKGFTWVEHWGRKCDFRNWQPAYLLSRWRKKWGMSNNSNINIRSKTRGWARYNKLKHRKESY